MFERIAWAWDPSPFEGELLTKFGEQLLAIEIAEGLVDELLPEDADADGYAHAWIALLADINRLAPGLQLSAVELAAPRRLLAGYFLKVGDFQAAVQELLASVDERFNGGHFAQAAALLQMFDTDPATRRNNERNLFYETMLTAFMGKRVKRAIKREQWAAAMKALPTDPMEALKTLVQLFEDVAGIKFHSLQQIDTATEPWNKVAASLDHNQSRDLTQRIGAPAMRPLSSTQSGAEIQARAASHLDHATLADYLERITLSAYFHTLATGRTGYEPFILAYHAWLSTRFSVIATRVLPTIHRDSLDESTLLSHVVGTQVDLLLENPLEALVVPSASGAADAVAEVVRGLRNLDPHEVPEGLYNLGGLLMDEALEFNSVPFVQRVRMHRLV
jgi:hypothetical protein